MSALALLHLAAEGAAAAPLARGGGASRLLLLVAAGLVSLAVGVYVFYLRTGRGRAEDEETKPHP